MNIEEEIKLWQESECIEVMRQTGFKTGDHIVDFGCGIGNYTFPLSAVVQEQGKIYAVDIDRYILKKIRKRTEQKNIHNIYLVQPKPEGYLEIPDASVDGFLIYDLIHSLGAARKQVLSESYRVLKNGAILSVLPFHMVNSQIKELVYTIENLGFRLDNVQQSGGIHFEMHRYLNRKSEHLEDYERGDIYNFRKSGSDGDRADFS